MVYHVSKRFLKKALNLPLKFGYFHFHVNSSTFFTVSRLLIFVSAEPSWTILWIDRSEPRFKSHTGGKIRKTLKSDGNFNGFCWFSAKSDSKLFCPDQENERQNILLSIEKKNYFCQMLIDNASRYNIHYNFWIF